MNSSNYIKSAKYIIEHNSFCGKLFCCNYPLLEKTTEIKLCLTLFNEDRVNYCKQWLKDNNKVNKLKKFIK